MKRADSVLTACFEERAQLNISEPATSTGCQHGSTIEVCLFLVTIVVFVLAVRTPHCQDAGSSAEV